MTSEQMTNPVYAGEKPETMTDALKRRARHIYEADGCCSCSWCRVNAPLVDAARIKATGRPWTAKA